MTTAPDAAGGNNPRRVDAPPLMPAERAPLLNPRIGLVGCGMVGDIHRARLLAESGVEIVALCDPDADALSRLANRLPRRPRLFRSEADLLDAGGVDAVVLCTPHARHAFQIRHALEAGVHVLCEKPFVTDADEAIELVALARSRGLLLFVSFTRRSRGHARFLIQAARERIGPLTQIIITRAQPWRERHGRTWRMHASEGGGFLLDAGASLLDLTLRLAGGAPVADARAELTRPRGSADGLAFDVDVRAFVRLYFGASGGSGGGGSAFPPTATLHLLGDAAEQIERIDLFGENGTASWSLREDAEATLYVRPVGGPTELVDAAPFRAPLPDAAFIAALRAGKSAASGVDDAPDVYDAASALLVVELVQRLYETAEWR